MGIIAAVGRLLVPVMRTPGGQMLRAFVLPMTADAAPDATRADTDTVMMDEALALTQRAAGRTSPNPLVGAVVVRDGQVVGRGFHARAGEPHAEVLALSDAGARAWGAAMYVSLEPCNHTGRTGPCTDALIAAGIRRVVVAMQDPDPQVNGRGIARLREAGIEVQVGLREEHAQRLNEFFIKHRQTGLPFVTLKWAMSLDGRIAARRGNPTAITWTGARQYVHGLHNVYDAVMVGAGTVLADDPLLTCRLPTGTVPSPHHPLRIVDSRLRTPSRARVVTGVHEAPALIATTRAAPPDRIEVMRRAGVEVVVQEQVDGRVDLRALMATRWAARRTERARGGRGRGRLIGADGGHRRQGGRHCGAQGDGWR
jgi:diaminohydroxyphosphoribosylaminopyrimidine deaminase/5-amino-6-(5-phosphoribosylamino)uracil reductase